jgi:hypothetical protein
MRSIALSLLLVFTFVASASADDLPNRVFNGKIMTSNKRFPTTSKSQSAYVSQIKKQSTSNFMEDKTDHSWMIYFAAFLKRPLNDVEYTIKFYELGGSGQRLLGTSDQFNDERGQKTIVSKIKLDKKSFGVNKELLMTIENKGTVYASARFKILGEGDKFSGKVNFSEDEAEGKDNEDGDDSAKKK